MDKRIIYACALAAALFAVPAFALQNVANTSQKGSLLIFPQITVDPADFSNTYIEISNDNISKVHLECYYVNERKGRVDFDFYLTPKATVSFDVLTGAGDIAAPQFPTSGTFTLYNGSTRRGELVCFAVDAGVQNQISFNHLTGTATVVNFNDTVSRQSKQAFKYNAWSFIARNATGLPEDDNVIQGTAGDLELTGGLAGTYDGCPHYNIATFMANGASLTSLTTIDNDLVGVSCNQDLRQDFVLHLTKLKFFQWNAHEDSRSGSYVCVDSVFSVPLDNSAVVNGTNFDFSTLRTANARFTVKGVASTQCPGPPAAESAGLLGVLDSSVALAGGSEDQEIGNTTQGAGLEAGFVFWDPSGSVPKTSRRR